MEPHVLARGAESRTVPPSGTGAWVNRPHHRIIVRSLTLCVVVLGWALTAPSASADLGSGIAYIIGGILEVPRATLAGTFGGFPILGTVFGALSGTLRGLAMVTRGALELVPVAAKLAPLIPVFL